MSIEANKELVFIWRVAGGKLVESWGVADRFGMLHRYVERRRARRRTA